MKKRHNVLKKLLISTFLVLATTPASAQLIPDNTLGQEASTVNNSTLIKGGNADLVNGGAQRGSNLFHSFTEFSINNGQRVYFANPSGVQNILTRVTGGNASNILGTLGVDGAANLFIINPNGILFGQNASLDIQGSFVGTTANAVKFGNQGIFSATNPETAPLLTIQPSALLFNQINQQASITNQSQAPAGIKPVGENVTGLRVPDGKSLLLVGGNVNIDGSAVRAYGGNIELAGLAAPGNIELNIAGDNLALVMPDVNRANVLLSNGAELNVRGSNGGNINIYARNLDATGESKIRAGIDKGLGTPSSQGGNIVVNATGTISLSNNSLISNTLRADAFGQSGNVNISTGSLNLKNNSYVDVSTFGNGSAGSAVIQAKDNVNLIRDGGIFSSVEKGAVGNAGNIQIQTSSLSLFEGAEINTRTYGQGNAGSIDINAGDAITLDGKGKDVFSRIISGINPESTGNTGNIQLTTNTLNLSNGAFIANSSIGKGNAGNITIDARDIALDSRSYVTSSIYNQAEGKAGNIQVNTETLSLRGGSSLSTTTSGKGDAGNITINARDSIKLDGILPYEMDGISSYARSNIQSDVIGGAIGNAGNINLTTGFLQLTNGAEISSDTNGQGNAGNITVNARDAVTLDGFGKVFTEQYGEINLSSSISSDVVFKGIGKGGDININARTLVLKNTGEINADTYGQGDAGNIFIKASEGVSLSNENNIDFTQISSFVSDKATGNGGTINIEAGNLSLDNASLFTSTSGKGNAGSIVIKVNDLVSLTNNGRFSTSVQQNAVGNGGNIDVQAERLFLDNGSDFFAATFGQGNAGNISIKAADSVFLQNAFVSSSVGKEGIGNGGSINIFTVTLTLTDNNILSTSISGKGRAGDVSITANGNVLINNGAFINSSTEGQGDAGKVSIRTLGDVTISGRGERTASLISTGILDTGVGNGSDIEINARNFNLYNGASLISLTAGKGNAGSVIINTLDSTTIKDSSIGAFTNGQGNAGKVVIRAGGDVSIVDKSNINNIVTSLAIGDGGDIEISASNLLLANGVYLLTTTIGKGNAGSVRINTTGDITIKNASQINASTFGEGDAGNVTVNAGNTLFISGTTNDGKFFDSGIFTTVVRDAGFIGKGKSGNINVTARNLSLNSAGLSVSSFGDSAGGDIDINSNTVRLDNKSIIAAATTSGNGGNINLTAADFLLLRNNSNITTTGGFDNESGGDGGNININTPFIVADKNENSDIAANAFTGKGGNVNIRARNIFGIEPQFKSTNQSDITASSQLGVQGNISIAKPNFDATQAITELPNKVVDASSQIGQICPRGVYANRQEGHFTITGAGSLPPNPLEMLPGTQTLTTLATLNENKIGAQVRESKLDKVEITEAQGLVKNIDGSVELVAMVPTVTPRANGAVASCPS
ncbi:filamentous haemagglutinin outer membrane protein [Rivularia sp. IAM M-261]|nr:filamentous haemagglutinin outer membrane protein [Rivularia sp. IAM M-261]